MLLHKECTRDPLFIFSKVRCRFNVLCLVRRPTKIFRSLLIHPSHVSVQEPFLSRRYSITLKQKGKDPQTPQSRGHLRMVIDRLTIFQKDKKNRNHNRNQSNWRECAGEIRPAGPWWDTFHSNGGAKESCPKHCPATI